jgi:hypothetical protein
MLVTFEGQQLLEPGQPLLRDPAIGALRQVSLEFARWKVAEPALGEVLRQTLCFAAIHTADHK